MALWNKFDADQLAPNAIRPMKYFDFYTIAGDHRRAACVRLYAKGYPDVVAPGQPQFRSNFSDCVFRLKGEQAKEIGRIDNITTVNRAPDAIDCIFLATTTMKKLTVQHIVENPVKFQVALAVLKSLKATDINKIPGYETVDVTTLADVEYPALTTLADALIWDTSTGKILQPLRKTMNFLDYRELVYELILETCKHALLSGEALNPRGKRGWRYSILMSMHGDLVTSLLFQIDEMLKKNLITFATTEPEK
jgi:hypothetical protein